VSNKGIIRSIMEYVHREETRQFSECYEQALLMPEKQLYDLLAEEEATYFTAEYGNMSNLSTCGCQHRIQQDHIVCGCSMCNLHKKSIERIAYMTAMRDRDETLYSKVVVQSVVRARPLIKSRTIHEYLFSYDFLNEKEIPDICMEMLLGKNGIYYRKPFVYEFETTAKSITRERLQLLKKYTAGSKVIIRIGVECADEWIRNHWLIKQTSDDDILKAVAACKEFGFQITANILFGLPGFTEENAILTFIQSVEWVDSIGVDTISCSLLDRYENTLQGYIYDHLQTDFDLIACKIADGSHTGLPWPFSFIRALAYLEKNKPSVLRKIVFGQFHPDYIDGAHTIAYNYTRTCSCANFVTNFMARGMLQKNQSISALEAAIPKDPCYPHYLNLLAAQNSVTDLNDNLRRVVTAISKQHYFDWEKEVEAFQNALKER